MLHGTCLVTGGAGFIGCAISTALAQAFGRVVAFDNLHPQIHARRERPDALAHKAELVEGDVTVANDWDRLLADCRPDVVIHLAAETGTGQSLTEASRHARVNVTGTTEMLDAFVRHECRPRRVVLSSSRAVYGEGAWKDISTERVIYPGQRSRAMLERGAWDFPGLQCLPFRAAITEARPTSIYGATKLAQEHVLRAWALAFDVEPVVLRLQNVYGPGQSLSNPYTGIVSLFVRMAREGKSIPVYEDGRIIRDFVFIEDVARAIVQATTRDDPGSGPFDVGLGEPASILDLSRLIALRYGAPEPHINGAFRNGDVRCASCTIEETVLGLHWKPEWSLASGLAALCTWIDGEMPP